MNHYDYIYTDISEVPLDEDIPSDLGDQPISNSLTETGIERSLMTAFPRTPAFVMPFKVAVKNGSKGKHVLAIKRALSHAGYIKWGGFTPIFGPYAVKSLRKFQQQHHLHVDGVVGPNTLKRLAPYFDAYSFLLYEGYTPSQSRDVRIREAVKAYCLWGYNHRGSMHYSMTRPMDFMNNLKHLPIWNDCSEFATKAYKFAGAPDPNGWKYNGRGYTGDMANHGRRVFLKNAAVADLILYGSPPRYQHVAVYIGGNRVISHGSEGGPYLLAPTYRSDLAGVRRYI